MKKRTVAYLTAALACCVALVGGTLAYFTDTDAADNVFTVGNVDITLIEQQRNADGSALVDFEPATKKNLLPLVGSAQDGDDPNFGLPTAKNYVDKIITVENEGSEPAWVRAYFAIPSVLDDGEDTYNASMNIIHFNQGNVLDNGAWRSTAGTEWIWMTDGAWNYFEYDGEDGIHYNVYYADYYQPLASGATTERFVDGVYLDSSVDNVYDADGNLSYVAFGQPIVEPAGWDWGNLVFPVATVAVQADGFASAAEAITTAFGANYNPFLA